jgi:hypothetical protein
MGIIKMKNFKLYVIITVALLLISFAACSQPVSQPEQEFFDQCDRMQKNIEQAQSIASKLEHFNWNEFSAIGILYPPQGICPVGNLPIVEKTSVDKKLLNRVVPLPDQLPSPKTAETYSVQCDNCLKLAREVCLQSPYNESLASAAGPEKITLAQWQESCSQLQSALQGAEYLASRDKTIAADYTFPQLLAYFTASEEKVKRNYLDKFMAKSDEYIKLHDELIHSVQQARQTAIDLSNWQFSPQETSEQ